MARTVVDCARADAVMAGEEFSALDIPSLAGLRLGVAQGLPLKDLDATVSVRFAAAIADLDRAGARLTKEELSLFDDMLQANLKGGFAPPEAYAIHRDRLERRAGDVDENVRARIERGRDMSAADYVALAQERARLVRAMDARLSDLDALLMPTTPIVAPRLSEVATPDAFRPKNFLLLRNTGLVNFFDLCAVSLPLPRAGALPVGLMLVGRNGHDRRLLRIAAAVEKLLAG
jgi:aspartyl-tRNA(Asn)/glutamyl-tRNA(Gln) amidotransferase subunit A